MIQKDQFYTTFIQKVTLITFLIAVVFFMPWNNKTALGNDTISIDVSAMPLKKVLERISSTTGYEIKINENLMEKPLSIKLVDINLESGLKRIMKSLKLNNTAIIADESKKIIEIRVFDPSSDLLLVNIKKGANEEAGMTITEIEDLKKKQIAEISDDYIDTPPSESGGQGMTIAEIEALTRRQLAQIPNDFIETPPSESGKPGMTRSEVEALNKRQLEKILENYNETLPFESEEKGITKTEMEAPNK